MSAPNIKKPILRVHDTTVPHLDFIEKILLDELIRQGRAEIVSENLPYQLAGA